MNKNLKKTETKNANKETDDSNISFVPEYSCVGRVSLRGVA